MRLPDFRIEILIRRIDKKVIITNCLSGVHSPTLTKEKPNQILSGGGRTKQQANKNTWAHIQTHTCTPTPLTLNPWLNPFSQTDIKRSKKKKSYCVFGFPRLAVVILEAYEGLQARATFSHVSQRSAVSQVDVEVGSGLLYYFFKMLFREASEFWTVNTAICSSLALTKGDAPYNLWTTPRTCWRVLALRHFVAETPARLFFPSVP